MWKLLRSVNALIGNVIAISIKARNSNGNFSWYWLPTCFNALIAELKLINHSDVQKRRFQYMSIRMYNINNALASHNAFFKSHSLFREVIRVKFCNQKLWLHHNGHKFVSLCCLMLSRPCSLKSCFCLTSYLIPYLYKYFNAIILFCDSVCFYSLQLYILYMYIYDF